MQPILKLKKPWYRCDLDGRTYCAHVMMCVASHESKEEIVIYHICLSSFKGNYALPLDSGRLLADISNNVLLFNKNGELLPSFMWLVLFLFVECADNCRHCTCSFFLFFFFRTFCNYCVQAVWRGSCNGLSEVCIE